VSQQDVEVSDETEELEGDGDEGSPGLSDLELEGDIAAD